MRCRPVIGKRRAATATAVLFVALSGVRAEVLATDYGFAEYTYGTNICTGIKDPMNA